MLEGADAILVPGGFGERGFEGKILAAGYARQHNSLLGHLLRHAAVVIDVARNCADLPGAHSTEITLDTPHPVIGLITEWTDDSGIVEQRDADSDLGGTMRLGEQVCILNQGCLAERIYGQSMVRERHRHRYEVNNRYVDQLVASGLVIAGKSEDGEWSKWSNWRISWFIAYQFHPEFTSSPRDGHPLFSGFVQAGLDHAEAASAAKAQ